MIARQTAKKVRASDIVTGSFVKKEGFEPSFVTTKRGEDVSRARILGTVVDTFKSEDGNFASITIDDGSETLRVKAFKETEVLDNLKVGDIVDFVGKIREYNGEIYMIAEIARVITDPNFELLRRLELLKNENGAAPVAKVNDSVSNPAAEIPFNPEVESKPQEKSGENTEVKLSDRGELKKHILQIIGDNQDGIIYSELAGKVQAKETDMESVIDELLNEGICYEPSPGKIRKI